MSPATTREPSHWAGWALACASVLAVAACGGAPATSAAPTTTSVPASSVPASSVPTTTLPPTTTTAPPTTTATAPTTTGPTTSAPPTSVEPAPADFLRRGASGPEVLALQERLTSLGYWLGTADSTYGSLTEQAVLALQGAAGLRRDGVVGPETRTAVDTGVRPEARSETGAVTEIDREAGLLLFVRDGEVQTALHTSTGTFENYTFEGQRYLADTPDGDFAVTWAHNGWRDGALGMLYRPRYFHPDGIAVHGYSSVPAYPASHGCARVSLPAMDMIWSQELMPLESEVLVY